MKQPDPAKRILVVEDNEDVRKIVTVYLGSNGYEILEAADGLEGLKMAQEERPDVILFDVLLPRLDGIEALKRLRKTPWGAGVPVIMMSAVLQSKYLVAETAKLNVSFYLQKPFQVRNLLEKIRQATKPTARVQPSARPGLSGNDLFGDLTETNGRSVRSEVEEIPELGELEEYPFPLIVHELFAQSITCKLRIVSGTTEKRIYFLNGLSVYAESSIPAETLGAHLVDKGRLTAKQHATALVEMHRTGKRFGEVVLKQQLLGPHELFEELESHLIHKVVSTFEWKTGKFKIEHGDSWKDDIIIARMPAGRIILDGVLKFWSSKEIFERMQVDSKSETFLLEESRYSQADLSLSIREVKILRLVKKKATINDIVAQIGDLDAVLGTLYALFLMERVGFMIGSSSGQKAVTLSGDEPIEYPQTGKIATRDETANQFLAEYIKYRTADYFNLLGVKRDASAEEITKAFKERQRRYHPDTLVNIDRGLVHEKIEELFVRIHTAHQTLISPEARERYVEQLDEEEKKSLLASQDKTGQHRTQSGKDRHEILFEDGFSFLRNGDFARALPLLKQAEELENRPRYSAYRIWTAYLVAPRKMSAHTEKDLVALFKKNPELALTAYLLGNYYLREEKNNRAEKLFEKALEIDPQNIDAARQLRILRMRQQTETSGLLDIFKKK